ncbi:MAG: mucoidy inhibitor MuiA family protein [Erysipelotrichaceae bacterium]|nr:mucoidy inhibitor MuiA family protein [Erysipelotrichaceae bacterium]
MQTIQTTVSAVQVYRRGAEITRKGSVVLEQGTNTLRILGLSKGSDMDTVKLFFPAGTGLSDIRFSYGTEDEPEDRPSAKIRDDMTALQRQKEIHELQISLWKSNGAFQGTSKPDLTDVENYITRLPDRLNKLYESINDINSRIRKLEKDLSEAERLESLPVITAVLEVPSAGTYPFEVRYHDVHAMWNFVYEIHTDAEGPVTMKSRARVSQNTDEDWENIPVSLLTSTPSGGSVPELSPVYLSFRKPQPKILAKNAAMGRNMMAMSAPMMAMMDEAEDSAIAVEETVEMARIETEGADVSSEETMTEYTLPGRKTIPSGTKGVMADLKVYELPAEYELLAVPKKDVHVYLVAKLKTKDLPSDIRGTAGIYLNGVYSGETSVAPDLTKETLNIPLGKAEGIQVSRTEKKRKTSDALLKNQRTTEYVYELKLTNSRNTEVTVTVQDQIPSSQEKTIIIETKNNDHAEAADNGILTWKCAAGPKETKVLNLAYNVSWPKDKQLYETVRPSVCPSCGYDVPDDLRFCPECGYKMY